MRYQDLEPHVDHEIECTRDSIGNPPLYTVTLECVTCGEDLASCEADGPDWGMLVDEAYERNFK